MKLHRSIVCAICCMLIVAVSATVSLAGVVVALTQSNEILRFDASNPGSTSAPVMITGIQSGESLVGIDFRPSNGLLYGVTTNQFTGRIYTIDAFTGAATLSSTLNAPILGSNFGVDFNPVADRLRVTSDSGQNLRINVSNGATILDGNLRYGAGDVNAGVAPNVVSSAYTNSFAGTTSTALYNLDLSTQSLVLQSPPNDGTMQTVGTLDGIAFPEASFDIDGLGNIGYVVLNGFEFSQIDLATGALTYIGDINTSSSIVGISTISAVPEPSSMALLAVAASGFGWARRRRQKRLSAAEETPAV